MIFELWGVRKAVCPLKSDDHPIDFGVAFILDKPICGGVKQMGWSKCMGFQKYSRHFEHEILHQNGHIQYPILRQSNSMTLQKKSLCLMVEVWFVKKCRRVCSLSSLFKLAYSP